MKEYLESGRIVGTHGVRGMMRIQPWCDRPEDFCSFKKLYIKNGTSVFEVIDARVHGNVIIAALAGVDSMEKAEALRGTVVCVARADVSLSDGQYFVDDIIGCDVFNAETGEKLGTVVDISSIPGANDVWHIETEDGIRLVPKTNEIVKSVDVAAKKICICVMKGLFDDED